MIGDILFFLGIIGGVIFMEMDPDTLEKRILSINELRLLSKNQREEPLRLKRQTGRAHLGMFICFLLALIGVMIRF